MSTINLTRTTTTEKAVAQLRTYARYIDEHAENIIGNIDRPNWVTESGIQISFTLLEHEAAPILTVTKEYLVPDALHDISGRMYELGIEAGE